MNGKKIGMAVKEILVYNSFMIGTWELIVIIAILVLIFGAKRIPDIARSIGKGIKEFRKGLEEKEDLSVKEEDKKKD